MIQWFKEEGVVAYDGDWQAPAQTEQLAYQHCRDRFHGRDRAIYIGFPWATLIDHAQTKSIGVKKLDAALSELAVSISNTSQLRRITVCQHIKALEFIDRFERIGVTDLFWPHAEFKTCRVKGIRIHPFPLYPVQTEHLDRVALGKEPDERRYLFSFAGAYDPRFYRTAAREWILALPARTQSYEAFLKSRDEWHYQRAVYDEQIKGIAVSADHERVLTTRAAEYVNVLADSIFSLCPSGSGPNSIRLWESLALGSIPVILADGLKLPGDADTWHRAAVFVRESREAIASLPDLLCALRSKPKLLAAKREACGEIYERYGPAYFVPDVLNVAAVLRRSVGDVKRLKRVVVLDPGLRDSLSHHHVINRNLGRLAIERGYDLVVCASRSMTDNDLPYMTTRVFLRGIYEDRADIDAKQFQSLVRDHYSDIQQMLGEGSNIDLLIVHTATAALLQALALALVKETAKSIRALSIQLMFHPLSFPGEKRGGVSHARYLTALRSLAKNASARRTPLALSTSCYLFAAIYSDLVGREFKVHPYALSAVGVMPALGPPEYADEVLLYCGDPKIDKGLSWICEALPEILGRFPTRRFVVQLGTNRFGDSQVASSFEVARNVRRSFSNLELVDGHIHFDRWYKMIGQAGIVVIPYDPKAYEHKTSAIFWEAISIVSPSVRRRLVVTKGSWMEREASAEGMNAVACTFGDTESLISALESAFAASLGMPTRRENTTNDVFLLSGLENEPAFGQGD